MGRKEKFEERIAYVTSVMGRHLRFHVKWEAVAYFQWSSKISREYRGLREPIHFSNSVLHLTRVMAYSMQENFNFTSTQLGTLFIDSEISNCRRGENNNRHVNLTFLLHSSRQFSGKRIEKQTWSWSGSRKAEEVWKTMQLVGRCQKNEKSLKRLKFLKA